MIKKQLIMLSLSLFIGMATFAQKSELKAADKALKKKDYAGALSAISQAESLIANADVKSKAKFYFIKGMAMYGNGSNYDIDALAETLNKVLAIEKGKATNYSVQASETITAIAVDLKDKAYKNFQSANVSLNVDDFKKAANGYLSVYKLVSSDTISLYSSAYLNFFGKEYQKSIDQFQQLLDMNYDGSIAIYKATSIVNGEDLQYNSKKEMDQQVRLKIVDNARVENTPSKVNDIIKYMALDYVGLGQNDKALASIAKARENAPDDYSLIIEEAKVYFKMDDMTKYAEKIEEALLIEPNDPQLHNIIGALSIDFGDLVKAEKHLKKTIELDSENGDAYRNMGNLILRKADVVQKEMDLNAMNFAKYDELEATKKHPLLRESLPYLEKAYELIPTEFSKDQLNSLYRNLDMDKRVE